ncbi:LPXTG cell wall anchor domain-containing protein [Bacillus tuaregi]|nr:LPXTG cell wall anchor domain-containing protein [Bacillus tuaregi]
MFSLSDAAAQLLFIGVLMIIGWAIFSLVRRKKNK